jgi:hypothetical protein
LRRLAEVERRRLFERDGHLSVVAWLATRFRVAWGRARQSVRVARALEEMPIARRAFEEGELPLSAVGALVSAREVDTEAFSRSEALLVDAASQPAGALRLVVERWRERSSASAPPTSRNACTRGDACTPRSPSAAWCASTASSIA